MAFHASGLPSIASATTELWPSISGALLFPAARTPRPSKTTQGRIAHRDRTAATASAGPVVEAQVAPSSRSTLPDFLRDTDAALKLPFLSRNSLGTTSSLGIFTETPSMSLRPAMMGSPLLRRSLSALTSRPLGTPYAARLMSTYQPIRSPSSFCTPLTYRLLQTRGFGSGNGVSRTVLASREAAANRNPSSATAQNSFYQALLKANMPAIVVERYQSGRFAVNEGTTEAYYKALSMINGTAGSAQAAGTPGLSPTQVRAVGQAVAAQHSGGNMAASVKGVGTKDGPLHVVVDETFGASFFRWVKFVLWFGLIAYLCLVVITMAVEALSSLRRPGSKTDFNEVKPENQKARFTDVHGCDEAKEEVQDIVDFLRNPDRYTSLGGKMPKGVLLVGPPGTGKTLLARAVAGEAGVPFFFMSGSEFDEVYVGVGAKRVRELFNAAKAKSPSIIFIDELDAIGGRRHSRDASYVRQTLNQLLTEMDGFEQNSGVIVMAATNFPESLDDALTRPGRFDRHVTVSLPDVRGRIAILNYHAQKIKAAPDVNLQAIAGRTSGLSGADLENIVNLAAIHASKLKATAVAQKHFEWAKDKVIMGSEKKSMVISPKEKEMTAYHEAGHALVAYFSKSPSSELYKVTILPRGNTLGHTAFLPEMDKYSMTLKEHLDVIDRAMGGKAAEEIVYGTDQTSNGVSSDLDSATRIAWQMVGQLGMSEKLGPVEYLRNYNNLSSETRAMVEAEVKKVLDASYDRARNLLISRRTELDLLAKALVEYETLDKAEVEAILRGEKLQGRVPVPPGPMKVPKPSTPVGETGLPLPPLSGEESGSPNPPPPPPAAARENKEGGK
ncbi:peptidase family M41-domain-containing protein [Immersiella caudata]|uniref:Peptidase family M41-domain-containing protein n=1 Tax=Immersiella caudata TaxID=314043 RepID=A0AA40C674_9PEZI|nr:peptidase family M41-domain-containing protein [Immersiella caudata]